jgi:TatD DNase family protein
MIQQFPQLTDTHCHLNSSQFEADLTDVLQRASEAGIARILIPGMDLESSEKAVQLAESHELLYAAVGFHPHNVGNWADDVLSKLKGLADSPKVVAIGEIGLDYYREYVPVAAQLHAFRHQLDLALELELPVVLHNRESIHHILEEIQSRNGDFPAGRSGVLHSYAGTTEQASRAIELDLYLGIGGPVTYRNANAVAEVVRAVSGDRLLLETDAPYLPPQTHRGQRNEPAYVRFVAEELSTILDITTPALCSHMYQNSVQLFGWANGS